MRQTANELAAVIESIREVPAYLAKPVLFSFEMKCHRETADADCWWKLWLAQNELAAELLSHRRGLRESVPGLIARKKSKQLTEAMGQEFLL